MSEVVDVLAGECEAFGHVLEGLSEAQFALPTRCPPWDVKDLVAHMWRNLFRIPTALDGEPLDAADTDSVTYWRAYDPADDSPMIAQHAQETAAEHATGAKLAQSFDELWRSAVARARAEDPARVIASWWGPRLRLDEFLKTRVLETVVHGVDMTTALGTDPVATDAGTGVVVDILTGLLGEPPPDSLGWSAVDFIDRGCGRVPLTESERARLGPAAEKFPLLG